MASTTTFVCTMNTGKPKWSRYVFPFAIDAFAQLGSDLYIRHGDKVSKVSEEFADDGEHWFEGVSQVFPGVVQWNWNDFGQPGVTKMLESFDYVGEGQPPHISIGFDQANMGAFTTPYQLPSDTLTGCPVPMPVSAPTLSVKLEWVGGEAWSCNAVNLHLSDMAGQP